MTHERVVAVINGKGGVGKTSVTAGVGVLTAKTSQRVLLVDLDPQANLGHDLGYEALGLGDDGAGLTRALQFGEPPNILRDVRPGVDVIPGGRYLRDLAAVLDARQRATDEASALLTLSRALADVTPDYALTLLDCPPGEQVLQMAALAMARYALVPTKSDRSSRMGMVEVAERFAAVLPVNPQLRLLAVLLYGVGRAKRVQTEARVWINEALDGQAPVLEATVRHAEAAAVRVRELGLLPFELEQARAVGVTAAVAKEAASLAEDWAAVTTEVLTVLLAAEAATVGEAA